MEKSEALEWLADGYSIISPDLAELICQTINVQFNRGLIQNYRSDRPGTFKGLTMDPTFESKPGVYTYNLSAHVAQELGVYKQVKEYFGRGRQAREWGEAIERCLNEKTTQ